jgi:hypothetical protein
MVAVRGSESMIHNLQINISCRQREDGSELVRLPDRERSNIAAREQYHPRTASSNGGLTGSQGQTVGYQSGIVPPMLCGQNCHSPDRNCDQRDQYPDHDDPGSLVPSFGNRQGYETCVFGSC